MTLVSSTEGKTVFQNFIQNSIRPSHKAFEKGGIEEGVRLFVNGVLGDGSYEQMPIIAHISMLENAHELMGEMNSMNAKGVDFFPAFSCKEAQKINIPTLLVDGEISPTFLRLINDALERCLPDNERVVIPAASHDLKIQEPPVFSETVLPFLDGH
ncbi:alpha/beta hydrolase [Aliifodinibius sp. S!AR15-10]|uniref:alpha/beta fold hydrolase n=1 Tax=Aliifodinibius sp. S!AR15-10 TaxID=2950437 RepID=UPI002856C7F5|nr:alpha/beta hydrolase [Aliifodinibius sp. S!AR15-10]MDR8392433.1 alpha/beta hydrolase [Aliifodinibius sp. S!AR15-10]